MQVFTLGLGNWLRCLTTRNPLVRITDRIEAAAVLSIVVVALLAAPFAGAAGTVTYDRLARQYAMDRASRHVVVATVTGDSVVTPAAYQEPFLTPVRWNFRGSQHTGEVRTSQKSTGDTVSVWVDASGDQSTRPLTDATATTEAVIAGFGLWLLSVGLAAAAFAAVRLRLNRLRDAAWDRELDDLADNGGRTNRNA